MEKSKIIILIIIISIIAVGYYIYRKFYPTDFQFSTDNSNTNTPDYPIYYGVRSNGVRYLQRQLNNNFPVKLVVDGIWGQKTEAAAVQFLGVNRFASQQEVNYYISTKSNSVLTNVNTNSNNNYYLWALALEKAMKGLGTDEEAIYKTFQAMKNQADYDATKKVFDSWYPKEKLEGWLKDDLTSQELRKCREILNSKGINVNF
ncbi:MAG TPA: hypothetical protein PK495_08325 [Bacteroidales bacterium]|nr:hypothetical protein [Bacteroidales bacterium]HQB20564.1 hypothetical protein [Bacteroidales bacterium]